MIDRRADPLWQGARGMHARMHTDKEGTAREKLSTRVPVEFAV